MLWASKRGLLEWRGDSGSSEDSRRSATKISGVWRVARGLKNAKLKMKLLLGIALKLGAFVDNEL